MKNFSLNAEQKILVEKNLGVVRFAIHKNIIVNDNLFGFEYDDLYQEGCIWLCKAALSYNEARDVKFATYAEKVVSNGLRTYCRLMCGKQKHQISVPAQTEPDTDGFSLEQIPAEDSLDKIFEEQDILLLLQKQVLCLPDYCLPRHCSLPDCHQRLHIWSHLLLRSR